MKQSHNGQRFVVFALENQEEIDYGMPARVMLQEALEYDRQMREIRRENQRIYFANMDLHMQEDESCLKMDDESWHVLGQMTDSKAIQSIITQKNRRERSVKGMCKAIDDLINDGKAEGKAEAIIMFLEEYGIVSEELKTKIMKQTDLQVLDKWVKLAIHTKEVDEFVRQSQKLV